MFQYKTHGTCSEKIELEIDGENRITFCKFYRGCAGNTAGLAKMVIGRDADEVKALLRGVPCRGSTSCPDQLSRAIEEYEKLRAQKGGREVEKE